MELLDTPTGECRTLAPADETVSGIGEKLVETLRVFEETTRMFPGVPWEIGYSGGKDSTVLCHIAFEYLLQSLAEGAPTPPEVYIVYADTLVDLPILRRHALSTIQSMSDYSRRFNGIVKTRVVKPSDDEDFFTMMIERGYPAPHFRFRWCMDRLKLAPTTDFLVQLNKFVMVTGVRIGESNSRRRNLTRRGQTEPIEHSGRNPKVAPLLNWSTSDIWGFLSLFRQPWNGNGYENLYEMYKLGDNLEGCGMCVATPNSRFGCWVCTVVRRDRLLESLANHGKEYGVLLRAKEGIRKTSLTPRLREFYPDGRYKGLNNEGRYQVVTILAEVLLEDRDALQGYLDDRRLRRRLLHWVEEAYDITGNTRLKDALSVLR